MVRPNCEALQTGTYDESEDPLYFNNSCSPPTRAVRVDLSLKSTLTALEASNQS